MDTDRHFEWRRFWVRRGGYLDRSDAGYLRDPEQATWWTPSELMSTEALASIPCLVLLGEPGLGKSTELKRLYTLAKQQCAGTVDACRYLDLYSFSSDVRLERALFGLPEMEKWHGATYALHLFIDSLDECLLRIDTVANILSEGLAGLPLDRLRLRIACRTSVWPDSLERHLRELWADNDIRILELAPLRRTDVAMAAHSETANEDDFLLQVERKRVVPFAVKPVTLKFLMGAYVRGSALPDSQTELYLEGCRLLCRETNVSRIGSGQLGLLDADQRLAVASRIAALMLFCDRTAMIHDEIQAAPEPGDLVVSAACGGEEFVEDIPVSVTRAAIRETLDTGLFSSQGPHRMGWAHRSYAEFLAARYLYEHNLEWEQKKSLLFFSTEQQPQVVPQLTEAAAWLASMDEDLFACMVAFAPEVMVGSAAALQCESQKARLVCELLAASEAQRLPDDRRIRNGYAKLNHPGLAEMLKPYIEDVTSYHVTRRMATDIAEACELRELWSSILNLAREHSAPTPLRENAAWALFRLADPSCVHELKSLIGLGADDDPDDDLRGCALRALWPHHLSANELFAALTRPRNVSYLGAYGMFLGHELVPGLRESDLVIALQWVREQAPSWELPYSYRDLPDKIIYKAWQSLDVPEVEKSLALTAVVRMKVSTEIVSDSELHALFADELAQNSTKRHLLTEAMASVLIESVEDCPSYLLSDTLFHEDVRWLIEKYEVAESAAEKALWADSLRFCRWAETREAWEALFCALGRHPDLAQIYASWFEPVLLESEDVARQRERYYRQQSRKAPIARAAVDALLAALDSGHTSAWYRISEILYLWRRPAGVFSIDVDLTALPSWQELTPSMRQRIVSTADLFVRQRGPSQPEWVGTNEYPLSCIHDYRAFDLLQREHPSSLEQLDPGTWQQWSATLVAIPLMPRDNLTRRRLVTMAYASASESVLEAVLRITDRDNDAGSAITYLDALVECWDQQLGRVLLYWAQNHPMSPTTSKSLLCALLERDVPGAQRFAEGIAADTSSAGIDGSVAAALALMWSGRAVAWDQIWRRVESDRNFGRALVVGLASEYDIPGRYVLNALSDVQLGSLLEWLYAEFPVEEDIILQEAHSPTPREEITYWRLSMLKELAARSTEHASGKLARLSASYPLNPALRAAADSAHEGMLRTAWHAPSPQSVLALVRDADKRLIHDGDQLLNLIEASLGRLQAKLHGETPAVFALWNQIPPDYCRPKDELSLSDFVKIHFDDDLCNRGIVINREVQIHRGEKTDIHVTAVRISGADAGSSINAIVEVKGCWHPELKTAFETQLVGRYLRENKCHHGLYLVGWFNCNEWDCTDPRKTRVPRLSIDEARELLHRQAKELSSTDVVVRAYVLDTALR